MLVLEGPAGNGIGFGIARALGTECRSVAHRHFPDGESYIRVPHVPRGEEVVVVQSTYAPQDKRIVELLFIIDALRRVGAGSITAVVPYLAYARQNKVFLEGEAAGADVIMRLLSESGAEALVTVEPHDTSMISKFDGRSAIVDPVGLFAPAIVKDVKSPVVIATDKGDRKRAERLAVLLGCACKHVEKRRNLKTGDVSAANELGDGLGEREAVIFDDMISSGGTVELTARMAAAEGCGRIVAAASHLIMADDAYERIKNAGVSKIYGLNTVPFGKAVTIDVSDTIAKALVSLSD